MSSRREIEDHAMAEAVKPLEDLVRDLPPDLRAEVRDFVEFLLAKRKTKPGRMLRQNWAGALRDYRDQYTSLELQRQAFNWQRDRCRD
jgi:hypothetical protein